MEFLKYKALLNLKTVNSELYTLVNGSDNDKDVADEFNSLACYFTTKYLVSGNHKTVDKILDTIINICQGYTKATFLLNLGCYK